MHSKTVVIASTNPVKIEAVQQAFRSFLSEETFDFIAKTGDSAVSSQPETDAETLQGARHRADNARITHPQADYWVGIEGGIDKRDDLTMEAFAWVVIIDGQQKGEARTMSFQLPPQVAHLIEQGHELGHADDLVFQQTDTKRKGGAIGLLTDNLISRTNLYTPAVIAALIPFVRQDLYSPVLDAQKTGS